MNRPPRPASDTDAASWLSGIDIWSRPWVPGLVGDGFDSYARILHPLGDDTDSPKWSDIAARHARTVDATTSWSEVTGGIVTGRGYPGDPMTGSLYPVALKPLCDNLSRFTTTPDRCWFAVWEGWGWMHPSGTGVLSAHLGPGPAPPPEPAPAEWQLNLDTAAFELPGRRYLLYRGDIWQACRIGWWMTRDWFRPQSPSMFWPDDHAWCVATEVDDDCTVVGGTAALIRSVLDDPHLEALELRRDAPPIRY